MPIFSSDSLHALTRAICVAAGSHATEADLIADQLVEANLTGHDSHGVGLIPEYVRRIDNGTLVPNQHAQVVQDQGAILVIEGGRGYGQVIGYEAMGLGVARAQEHGVALVAIRNSFHLGRIGHWAEQCARGGLASLHFVNVVDHAPLQAPHGGAAPRFATNPVCIGIPSDGPVPTVLDMATSKIALGKARVMMNKGELAPVDALLDADGKPTRDAAVMYREPQGAIIPMGEHKGSGLAIMCELLAGALTGAMTIQPENPQTGGIINNMLSVLIDPERLGGRAHLVREAGALLAYVKDTPPRDGFDEVLLPGEPEQRRRADRRANGIEVDDGTFAGILAAARAAGLPDTQIDTLSANRLS